MKVYIVDGNAFVEVAPNYLLYVCTQEELRTLGEEDILAKIDAAFVQFAWESTVRANQPRTS